MMPLVWVSLKCFCCEAHTLESMVKSNKMTAEEKANFLIVKLSEAQKRSKEASINRKDARAMTVQVRRLNQFVILRK